MNKLIIRRRTHDGMLQEGGRDMLVSLPAPPFQLDVTSDRPETDPRSMPVMRSYPDFSRPSMMDGGFAMRIWEYGQRLNWDCTISAAADALGISLKLARKAASRHGFLTRFKGSRDYSERQLYATTKAEATAIASKSRGYDVDENLLPLDRLIR